MTRKPRSSSQKSAGGVKGQDTVAVMSVIS